MLIRDQNADGAWTMAILELKTNISLQSIHRLSLIHRGDMSIIDDAYSSNTDGFAAVKYLESFLSGKSLSLGDSRIGIRNMQFTKTRGVIKNINQ